MIRSSRISYSGLIYQYGVILLKKALLFSIILITLITFTGLALANSSQIGLVAEIEITPDLIANSSEDGIWLVGLTADQNSVPDALGVRWIQEQSRFFSFWKLELVSELNLLGDKKVIELGEIEPELDKYEVSMAYDAASGEISVAILNLSNQENIFAAYWQGEPTNLALNAVANEQGQLLVKDSYQRYGLPFALEQSFRNYLLDFTEQGAQRKLGNSYIVGEKPGIMLEGPSASVPGSIQLYFGLEEAEWLLLDAPVAAGRINHSFSIDHLPSGEGSLVLRYVDGDYQFHIETKPLEVRDNRVDITVNSFGRNAAGKLVGNVLIKPQVGGTFDLPLLLEFNFMSQDKTESRLETIINDVLILEGTDNIEMSFELDLPASEGVVSIMAQTDAELDLRIANRDFKVESPEAKLVFADYHPFYRHRGLDGDWGGWGTGLRVEWENITASEKVFTYNSDLITREGYRDVASVIHPLVGPQSDQDPNYLEYQILLAKSANIDGFLLEWGGQGRSEDQTLQEMIKIAAKYDFKIGITWCTNWIINADDSQQTRVTKYRTNIQHLIDTLFSSGVGMFYQGHPVIVLFGMGNELDAASFGQYIANYEFDLPEGMKEPIFLRGLGTSVNQYDRWEPYIEGNFAWIPERVRDGAELPGHHFDIYGTLEDSVRYQERIYELNQEFYNSGRFKIRGNSASPGMDSRGASWGGTLKYIDREDGETYRAQWEFNVANRDGIDIVFLNTWNDYPEATVIEPTVEFGFRELITTEKYAAQFKEIKSDSTGVELPYRLFNLRTEARTWAQANYNLDQINQLLNEAGQLISNQKYAQAVQLMDQAHDKISNLYRDYPTEELEFDFKQLNQIDLSSGFNIQFPAGVGEKLHNNHFVGYLEFEYLDQGTNTINLMNGTREIARIRKADSGEWRYGKVEIFKSQVSFSGGDEQIHLSVRPSEASAIRNLSFGFEIYHKPESVQ